MHKVKMEKKHLTKNEILRRYTTPELPGEFQAISGFKKNNKYTGESEKILNSIPPMTMHKPILYKFPRRKTQVYNINDQWQADLIDMHKLAGNNFQHNFILTVIHILLYCFTTCYAS